MFKMKTIEQDESGRIIYKYYIFWQNGNNKIKKGYKTKREGGKENKLTAYGVHRGQDTDKDTTKMILFKGSKIPNKNTED